MIRNERTLGRAARWDGVLLGDPRRGGGGRRPLDAPADIIVVVPAGTEPAIYEESGATWVLITGWLDELRGLAAAPAPNSPA